jgi:hypothetical protein
MVAAHVGGADLGAELGGLPVEFHFALRDGGFEFAATLRAEGPLTVELPQALALFGDA